MSSKRLKNVSIARPFVYGNTASPLGTDRPASASPDHSHSWTVFVRGPNGENLDYFIKRVVFRLHETYPNSVRTIDQPPYEVTETGWGEFDINIRIYFNAVAGDKSITLYHRLKLHPYGEEANKVPPPPVVQSVIFDEVVFNEPTEELFNVLTSHKYGLPSRSTDRSKFSYQAENEEADRLAAAYDKVQAQLRIMREKIHQLEQRKKIMQEQQEKTKEDT
ncbi:hypothetical protein CANCADRAFT_870 [Tortispora caseinolytica NRRL Y-17796]|uniref:Protein AF-9 homolog n=1 Tax=Tortispora caseinolytica NRRL Y-17796 TaxID=767744 RepID=A0A1E4TKK3_9ASCO|nr:hypothetical protein CANCADRAFT_870 [Tortispora caseinolytica NRRL Y-17796]